MPNTPMTQRIRQIGDPILRDVSTPVDIAHLPNERINALIGDMKNTLNGIRAISNENGNALSAPQSGQSIRLILLRFNDQFVPMINPEFTALSDHKFAFDEECFSLYDQRATVRRFSEIEVSYFDENGTPHKATLRDEDAGLVQHEIDHLNGVLFIDHLGDVATAPIEDLLKEQPDRLRVVKQMIDYMRAPI